MSSMVPMMAQQPSSPIFTTSLAAAPQSPTSLWGRILKGNPLYPPRSLACSTARVAPCSNCVPWAPAHFLPGEPALPGALLSVLWLGLFPAGAGKGLGLYKMVYIGMLKIGIGNPVFRRIAVVILLLLVALRCRRLTPKEQSSRQKGPCPVFSVCFLSYSCRYIFLPFTLKMDTYYGIKKRSTA
jgi:hypothetical protein